MKQYDVKHFVEAFERIELKDKQPAWLDSIREEAMTYVRQHGLPTTRTEGWRYTDVGAISRQSYCQAVPLTLPSSEIEEKFNEISNQLTDSYNLTFVNGHFCESLSTVTHNNEGVKITYFDDMLEHAPFEIRDSLGRQAVLSSSAFVALNAAFVNQGVFISIPDGLSLDKPIQVIYLNEKHAVPYALHPRAIIALGNSSQAEIIEYYVGSADDAVYFLNNVTEIVLGKNASLKYYKVQQESHLSHHISHIFTEQQSDSHFYMHSLALGSMLARTNVYTKLCGRGTEANLRGVYIVGKNQQMDHYLCADHVSSHTSSHQHYKGVLSDNGRGVFNGKVRIGKGAQKSAAKQMNANLLLSEKCEIDTKPELEIYADDVKCSHGVTVGQLDDDMLFYMQARAIDLVQARRLLIFAFVWEVIDSVELSQLRQQLREYILGTEYGGHDFDNV